MDRKFEPVLTTATSSSLPPTGVERAVAGTRNRVLRNTYWLLALSLLPTVAGALPVCRSISSRCSSRRRS